MQANQTPVVWTVVIAAVVLLVIGAFGMSGLNSNLKLVGEKLDGLDIDETALANAIVAGIVIPELPVVDTEKVDDLWKVMFGDCSNELEISAKNEVIEEANKEWGDDMWDYITDNVEDFENFNKYHTLDDEETEVTIDKLGECLYQDYTTFNEGEDSKVTVELEYDFRYTKDTGVFKDVYKGTLYVTGTVTYEYDEDGDIDTEVELTYSL